METKKSVNTEFRFHNVGQGLFYSGEIERSGSYLRFVYDCGSETTKMISNAVETFKQSIKDSEIDMLVISHFHEDHVSGLEELFNSFTIKNVILPYFTPIERLLIALRNVGMPLWYYEFLSDPVEYLVEKGVERVVVLGGRHGRNEEYPQRPPQSPEGENSKLNFKLPEGKVLKNKIINNEWNWRRYIKDKKLWIRTHHGHVDGIGLWIFRFFNYQVPLHSLSDFRDCIESLNLSPNANSIKNAIKHGDARKKLKKCYDIIARGLKYNLNNTSLVMYHGPIRPRWTKQTTSLSSLMPYCNWCAFCQLLIRRNLLGNHEFGHFLCGDIDLHIKYDELKRHYAHYFDKILVAQVPHHGSYRSWNGEILNLINGGIWAVSAGIGNRYGHPHFSVVRDILSKGGVCHWVNELNGLIIKGRVEW